MRIVASGKRRAVLAATYLLLGVVLQSSSATVINDIRTLQDARQAPQAGLTCRDGDGNTVDWWLILKAPNGTRYAYIDAVSAASYPAAAGPHTHVHDMPRRGAAAGSGWPDTEGDATAPDGGWRAAGHLNSLRSPLSRTLLPLYPAANLTGCACSAHRPYVACLRWDTHSHNYY